jgi:ornithine--oxo-acid transaminase
MSVFTPGSHGSTFGGNPLAAAVALEALDTMIDEGLIERSAELGSHMLGRLKALHRPWIREVRGKGLWIGVDFDPAYVDARRIAEALLDKGVLTKETHETVIRFAPPLVVSRAQIDWAVDQLSAVIDELTRAHRHGSSA